MYTTGKFMKHLLKSNKMYNTVVKDIKKDIYEFSFFDKIEVQEENFKKNFKNNFFSIFMLSLIEFLEAEREDVVKYGKCLFYLRGIITCTDNIIDDESKGAIFLNGIKEKTTENTLLTLILQKNLEKIIFELDVKNTGISNAVLESIYLIAKSEGMRDRAIYGNYPGYNFISHEIHSGIGGELLKIGVLVPLHREKNDKFKDVSKVLYNLGLSLQGLDDLCDMEEDFYAGKINLATSFFMDRLQVDEETAVNLDILDTPAAEEYLKEIMSYSMESFRMLEELGYPINKKLGMKLLFHLFKIRGLEDLWDIYKREEEDEKNNFGIYAFND
ncbi:MULTISPECIES: hypothetical protein [Psychrilyobacter]|uniref:Uncharacterized protein n=1 Tax=Psychrilyobacter piezotolerans TaxID=2293438 RepID=A0ABX9KJR7_9FUSO|nr:MULTISPECIES: hypothetical protein [Psychrilyobacter]MCS5420871.1 hypothetical protein [Psychrilyobacter sp. S5]NDI76810.1 hypothetical protein [Psychrilyobacter piezotolerans]RDE65094.1 hypothetical protein DV867_02535 [Psychrilyobacter sp. S5]REI42664.1 hypothetical protein DYH56_02535 [Psychrilyobacter piezotolerans]